MAKKSLVLTRELIARAALWIIKIIDFSEKNFADYANQGIAVCVVRKGEVLYTLSLKEGKYPLRENFPEKAEKIARMVSREKKNLKNLFLTPAKFKEGDCYKESGGIWSEECEIGISVQGFLSKNINDEVAKHLLVRIKSLVDVEFARIKNSA